MTDHPSRRPAAAPDPHADEPAVGDPAAAVLEGADGLLELRWPDGADTVPITRAGLEMFVDIINAARRLAGVELEREAADPDQLTIYDELAATGRLIDVDDQPVDDTELGAGWPFR